MNHVARVLITPELLAQAMVFPEGTEIGAVSFQNDQDGRYVVLTVRHDNLRAVEDGTVPPVVKPRYVRYDERKLGAAFVDWGQDT